jgi:putative FmdB family regulatory protein
MPVYRYACPDCGYTFEQQQKFADSPVTQCPKCGKQNVYRLVNRVAVAFKGSGWYITDSKSERSNQTDETTRADSEAKQTTTKDATSLTNEQTTQ